MQKDTTHPDAMIKLFDRNNRNKLRLDLDEMDVVSLRTGLAQLIESLERFDEIVGVLSEMQNDWRNGTNPKKAAANSEAMIKSIKPTPIVDFAIFRDPKRFSWVIPNTTTYGVSLDELSKPQLVDAIKVAWADCRRFHKVARMFSTATKTVMKGVVVQSETTKENLAAENSPSPKPASPSRF